MLSEWQIVLLDNGLWLVPLMCIVALAVFPWKHWNSLFIEDEQPKH
jgi:predicted negative regulator of RcsB-dependent stress response